LHGPRDAKRADPRFRPRHRYHGNRDIVTKDGRGDADDADDELLAIDRHSIALHANQIVLEHGRIR
jgi:hypothetical protein